MAERLVCPHCGEEFGDNRDKYRHLGIGGCPQLYAALTEYAAPFCACGCGEKTTTSKRNERVYNKYIIGHNRRPKETVNGK